MSRYFVVRSGSNLSISPQNTCSKFCNTFLTPPLIEQKSQFAIQSIFLDSRFGNIPLQILHSQKHFFVFVAQVNGTFDLIDTVKIINIKYSHKELASHLNTQLNNREKCQFVLNRKKIDVHLTNCVLLVNPAVANFFGFAIDGEREQFENNDYLSYPSIGRRRVILGHNRFQTESIIPKCIKVNVEEMKSNLEPFVNRQVMCIISCDQQSLRKNPLHYVVTKKEYFPIKTPTLQNLHLKLTDENNLPLLLLPGEDTIIKFKIKEIMFNSYILRLSSNESTTVFNQNTNANFRIQLSQPLNTRRREMEVALSSAYLPSEVDNHQIFSNNAEMWFSVTTGLADAENVTKYFLSDIEGQVDPEKILNYLRLILEGKENVSEVVSIDFEDTIGFNCKETFSLELSPKFGRLVNRHNLTLFFERKESYTFGKINMASCYPQIIFLCCNFITPTSVGDKTIRLLKMIPFTHNDNNTTVKYEPHHLDFFPLAKNDSNLLHFELTDSQGKPIIFRNVNEEVMINLIFRDT